jgi:hypothetical protein
MSELVIHLDRPGCTAGEEVTGAVELRLDAPVTTRGVRLRLTGVEHTHITRSTGKTTVTYSDRRPIMEEEIVFAGEERIATAVQGLADVWNTLLNRIEHLTLDVGEYHYPFTFSLPAEAPPTYDGSSAEVEYRLLARVDVPFWTDLRCKRDLMVYPRAQPIAASPPVSIPYPPAEKKSIWLTEIGIPPRVCAELSLPRSRYAIGEVIEGTLTVEDVGNAQLRGVEFMLVAREEARADGHTNHIEHQAARLYQPWHAADAQGGAIPFQIEIREGIVPSLRRPFFSLDWAVRARLDVAWTLDARMSAPITIVLGDGGT